MNSFSFSIIHASLSQGVFHGFASNRLAAKTVSLSLFTLVSFPLCKCLAERRTCNKKERKKGGKRDLIKSPEL